MAEILNLMQNDAHIVDKVLQYNEGLRNTY